MGVVDILTVLAASLLSSVLAEGISWVLIYRTESYKRNKAQLDKLTSKVEKGKEVIIQKKDKKVERYEDQVKRLNADLKFARMKAMFAVAIVMIIFFGILSSAFDGVVVGTLPFEPPSFVQMRLFGTTPPKGSI